MGAVVQEYADGRKWVPIVLLDRNPASGRT
jgi:hypothetical protein